MKKLLQILILISMSLFLSSCYYDAFPEDLNPIDPDEEVSYKTDIMPLWAQCVGCHNGNEPPDLRDEFSYDELLNGFVVPNNPESSILYQSLLGTNGIPLMPPGSKWPESKISLVKSWIDQGAKDN